MDFLCELSATGSFLLIGVSESIGAEVDKAVDALLPELFETKDVA